MSKIPNIKFSNGYECPVLGLGTLNSKPGEVTQAVKDAIDLGYRHIDCALVYENEREVGVGIAAKISEGVVTREDLFITSKLWNTFHRPSIVEQTLLTTLDDLGLDYVDLYLVHWPFGFQEGDDLNPTTPDGWVIPSDYDYADTYKAMEEICVKGLAKSIGVSNFNEQQLSRILQNCTISPVVNQIENHPHLNQNKIAEFCKQNNIIITAYAPLGSPGKIIMNNNHCKLLEEPVLQDIAEKHNKSVAQVVLRYQIERGHIVIPKSVTKKRIEENMKIFDFKLAPVDMKRIDALDCNGRVCLFRIARKHKYYPF